MLGLPSQGRTVTAQEAQGLTTSATGGAERVSGGSGGFEGADGAHRTWTLTILAPTDWLNLNQRLHWAEKARRTKAWRLAGQVYARNQGMPKNLDKVQITAHIIKPTNRAYDAHNLIPTVKAIIDGLVDYQLITDDTNKHLIGPDMREGDKGQAGVQVTIKEIAP